jgi:alpha-L-rhamnosidase
MYGRVASSWTLKGGSFELSIEVPPNTRATVRLPNAKVDAVTESGRPAGSASGISRVRQDGETVVLEVGSGAYRFAYPYPPPRQGS